MTDETTDLKEQVSTAAEEAGASFSERYSEILGKVNETLDKVDWNQMGRIGKGVGVLVAVIVAQVLIKGVLAEPHHQRQAQCRGEQGADPAQGIPRLRAGRLLGLIRRLPSPQALGGRRISVWMHCSAWCQ
jgi:hypothetical protein